ncbi:MAG TPA: aminopeptidase N [Xanthobacteraceae bacterium]|jgi:aminopeptidase N|nr:aminopeptidase N [Xanthobacteraceae bacterium]
MRTDQNVPVRLENYRPPNWLVDTVELDVALERTATRVRATLALRPNPKAAAAPLVLDGDGLNLVSLRLEGEVLAADRYVATPDSLTITQLPPGPFRLEIETLVNPAANTHLSGLYRSGAAYCTQCEAEGFRRITYFPDRPDVMAVYTTRIEADVADAPVLLANGNLVSAGPIANTNRHFAVWHDPFPKPSYLFALVGGKLAFIEEPFRAMSGRMVTLRIYVEPGKEDRCGYAMDSLKRAMRWDEERFGREYDLDIFMIVAVSDFNMGAMENKGLNVFNDKYILANSATATDVDYGGIETVVAHEYFHNWTGNRITCRDWFQLCLKEGLTVFRDQEFTYDERSRAVERIKDVRGLRANQFVEDAGPLAHPVRPEVYREINNFYTPTVYEKGAEVVRMLSVLLGPETFRKGMDLYFARHDGQAATVDEFIQCFADTAQTDLTQFKLWYSQAGTPEVVVTGTYDQRQKTYRLDVAQTLAPTPGQSTKEPMVIPLVIGLVGPDGRDLPMRLADGRTIERGLLTLTTSAASFVLTGIEERPVPSLNRGFSAPVNLVANIGDKDLRFLAVHDSDPFNRWQAINTLSTRVLVDSAAAIRRGDAALDDPDLTAAVTAVLLDRTLEPAFVAQVISLPSEADIAREIASNVDPDAVLAARHALRRSLSGALFEGLARIYDTLAAVPEPFSTSADAAGRRALKNACLDLLSASGDADAVARCMRQYQSANNMTDRMAALATLSYCAVPERETAIADFYTRHADEPLIVDKWLMLQATIPEHATLDRIKALTKHPAFQMSNPNRVRSLIASFAMANPTQSNRPDGAGYDFLVSAVLELDQRNPQVAARLLSALKSWRVLEPGRRALAQAALRRVAAHASLSPDVGDIVQRALAEG